MCECVFILTAFQITLFCFINVFVVYARTFMRFYSHTERSQNNDSLADFERLLCSIVANLKIDTAHCTFIFKSMMMEFSPCVRECRVFIVILRMLEIALEIEIEREK